MQRHLAKMKALYEDDLTEGYGAIYLPYAFDSAIALRRIYWKMAMISVPSKNSWDTKMSAQR